MKSHAKDTACSSSESLKCSVFLVFLKEEGAGLYCPLGLVQMIEAQSFRQQWSSRLRRLGEHLLLNLRLILRAPEQLLRTKQQRPRWSSETRSDRFDSSCLCLCHTATASACSLQPTGHTKEALSRCCWMICAGQWRRQPNGCLCTLQMFEDDNIFSLGSADALSCWTGFWEDVRLLSFFIWKCWNQLFLFLSMFLMMCSKLVEMFEDDDI